MHTNRGPHRHFDATPRKNVQVDANLIDRTSGLNLDMDTTTVLQDSRWERFNADIDDDLADQAQAYERMKIRKLADERETVQKRTFTRWVNSHLQRVRTQIDNLYTDLRDGRSLLLLLEVLSGQKLQKPARGRMRIHCLENVEKVLSFLRHKQVKLENVGPGDIVDGNTRLTLGLIWTIILRFQIQDIDIVDENKERRSAKDALLLWCQMKTADYDNVNIVNFTSSWKNGLGFNAIIHKHLPHLIDYHKLPGENNRIDTLNNAFKIANDHCEIPCLLDAEDVAVDHPDEKSIMTYLAMYYHYFNKLKEHQLEGKRIGGVLDEILAIDKLKDQYENLTSELLKWIDSKIKEMNDRNFANSLSGIEKQYNDFDTYRKVEKPPKFEERGNIEVLLFELQTRLKANNRKPYLPKEGQMVSDINKKWTILEDAEYEREQLIIKEIQKQKYLERMAKTFNSKVLLRKTWIHDNNKKLVDNNNLGNDLSSINASIIKLNSLELDIIAYESRINDLSALAQILKKYNYYNFPEIEDSNTNVIQEWKNLEALLKDYKNNLNNLKDLYELLNNLDDLENNLLDLKYQLEKDENNLGNYLTEVDELNSKHQLLLKNLQTLKQEMENKKSDPKAHEQLVQNKFNKLNSIYEEILELANNRQNLLNQSKSLHQLMEDIEDHNNFIKQQNTVISNLNILSNSNEVNEINTQLRNFDRITDEIQAIQPSVMNTLKTGNDLVDNQHYAKNEIKDKITQLQNDWHDLEYKLSLTKQQLDDTKNIETIKSDCQNLNNKVNNNISKLNNLNFKNPELANSLTKFNNLKINYNQINDEVDNIEHKKLPKLKEQVKLCDSEAANFELNNLESSIYNYSNLAKDKNEDLNHIDLLSKDLTNCNALQEWCDDKRVVLGQIQIPDQLDQVDLVKRRVDGWENEIEQYQPTIQEIKNLPAKYHTQPESQEIVNNKVNNVIASWEDLVISINNLKEKLKAKQSTLEFALNCDEIINSCQEKMRLADAIVKNSSGDGQESPSKDLDINSVMNVQKKLASLERDRDALVNRVKELEDQAKLLAKVHPERANEINKKVAAMKEALDKLNEGIKEKQAGLGAAGALFSFIHELDDLEQWVKQSLQAIEDAVDPTTLSHVAELQNTHDALKAEIDSYDVSINRVCKTGRDLVKGRPDEEAINQRLDNLANDFEILKAKANERSTKLDNFNIELKFNAEAKQIETILDNKNTLMKNQLANLPQFVQESEQAVRNQEALVSALDGTRIRVEALDSDAAIATIPAQPNMQNRANEVTKKFEDIKNFADQTLLDLQHNVKYAKFNVDCAYFADWLTERKALLKTHDDATEAGSSYNPTESNQTSGVSANDGMEIHIAFQKHSAFMQELQANHDKLKKLHSDGKNLKELIPNKQSEIDDKLDNLQFAWDKLTQDCQDREKKLFEYRRAELLDKNIAELDNFANSINGKFDPSKPLSESDLGDLATVNRLLKDHELDKTALDFRKQELDATENRLADDLTGDELADMQNKVEALRQKFKDLDGPMNEKYQKLMEAKLYHQLKRDLTEELRWVDEKTALASSNNFGESLHAVQVLEAKHDTLINEVKQHEPVITDLLKRSIPNKEVEEQALLKENWEQLQNQFQDRSERLKLSGNAQNYLFDNEEANEWIYERAQMILAQEKQFLENEHSANRMIRKHNQNMEAINDYESKINNLAGVCRDIENNNNPDKVSCSERQADLETSFANLKNLANTRQDKLNKLFNKLKFKQELEEFNNWLSDKQRLADNSDTGKDTHHSERLLNKFDDWSNETNKLVDDKHQGCQESGHQLKNNDLDSTADVDNWLSNTETHVADLKNSIDNRKALLNAAFNKNKCLDDMNDITNQLNNKKLEIPKENGDDAERTRQLLKQHDTLSNEAKLLLDKAQEIDNNAVDMLNKYIDPNDQNIHNQVNLARNNLKDASDNLQTYLIERTRILKQVADTHDFNNIAGDLLEWIEETNKKIDGQQRPSDKTQVHSLMQEHANIKNELESRQPEFEQIYEDVAEIERNLDHMDARSWEKIAQVITELKDGFSQLENKWRNRNTYLLLAAEITGFWADCAHADIWLKSAENEENNNNPTDAKKALQELEQFESNMLAPWNKKFELLKKLTEYERQEQDRLEQEKQKTLQKQRDLEELKRKNEMRVIQEEQAPVVTNPVQRNPSNRRVKVVPKNESVTSAGNSTVNEVNTNATFSEENLVAKSVETSDSSQQNSPRDQSTDFTQEPSATSQQTTQRPSEAETEMKYEIIQNNQESDSHAQNIHRKAVKDVGEKTAKSRAWNQLYCVLSNGKLLFFKDQNTAAKAAQTGGGQYSGRLTYKSETPLDLAGCQCTVATDYTKRINVFRLKLSNGAEYLIQAANNQDMNTWVEKLQKIAAETTDNTATLDSNTSSDKKKSKSLFGRK